MCNKYIYLYYFIYSCTYSVFFCMLCVQALCTCIYKLTLVWLIQYCTRVVADFLLYAHTHMHFGLDTLSGRIHMRFS